MMNDSQLPADADRMDRTKRRRIEKTAERIRTAGKIPSRLGGRVRPADVRRQQYLAKIGQPHSATVAALTPVQPKKFHDLAGV